MEQEVQRVERRRRSKSTSITTLNRNSPPSSRTARKEKSIKKEKSSESDTVYWKIKKIQEEEIRKGSIWYLIDWADHPVTGEVFPHSWEPATNVTEAAIKEWNLRKVAQESKGEKRLSQDPSSSAQSNTSEPIRATNRKRGRKRSSTPPQQKKKPRKAGTSETARFQSVSLENYNSQERPTEIKDSYEELLPSAESAKVVYKPRVEIPPIPSTFNRAAYSPVPLSSSQPSGKYSQNQSDTTQSQLQTLSRTFGAFSSSQKTPLQEEGESSDEELPQPLFRRPARARKVFREELVVIPDSQETGSSPTVSKAALQADTGSSALPAAAQVSSRDEATLTSESQPSSSSSTKTPPRTFKDPNFNSQSSESRPRSHSSVKSLQEEETRPAPRLKPVEQELTLDEQGFQTQLPFASLEDEAQSALQFAQIESVEQEHILINQEFETHIQFSTQTGENTEGWNSESVVANSDASAGTEFRQRQSSGWSGLLPSFQAVSETVLGLSATVPQLPSQVTTKDTSRLQANRDTASEPSPVSPLAVWSRLRTAQYWQRFSSTQSGLVQRIERASEPLSPLAMEGQSFLTDPSQDTRLLMKAARLKAAEKRAAERLAARSTSTLPATPPAPEVPSQPLPLRETIPPPSPKASERASEEPESDTVPKNLDIMSLEDGNFLIPLPLMASIRDSYVQTIKNNKQTRLDYLEYGDEPEVVKRIDMMLDELDKQCDHPDLNADDFGSQRELPLEIQGRYAETVSTKCFFVGELIKAMRESDKHLVVLSRPGRMLEILQGLLIRHQLSKRDGKGNTYLPTNGSLRVTLLGFDYEETEEQRLEPASLVVVFSPCSDLSRYSALRRTPASLTLAPLVSLVITHSIQHLNLCIDKATPTNTRYFLLINYLSQTQEQVGKLDSEYPLLEDTAQDLAEFIIDSRAHSQRSPFWEMPPIEVINFESPQPPSYSPSQPTGATMVLDGANSDGVSSKRQLKFEETADEARKRQKVADGQLQSGVSQLGSDTMASDEVDRQLKQRIRELEDELEEKDKKLRSSAKLNKDLFLQVADLERGNTIIIPKYHEAINELARYERIMLQAKDAEKGIKNKYDSLVTTHNRLKAQKAAADTQLAAARTELKNSSLPLLAEVSRVKEENADLQLELDKLKKQRDVDANEREFIRNQYQDASSAAGEANAKNRTLETQAVDLRKQADQNSVLIHQLARDTALDQYTGAIRSLQGENAELNNELKRVNDETRQRRVRQARGASTPRSPRTTGTMSPGGVNQPRNGSRVMGAGGSRVGSPAPGEPIRGTFGEGSAIGKQWGRFQQ